MLHIILMLFLPIHSCNKILLPMVFWYAFFEV